MDRIEARTSFQADCAMLAARGVYLQPSVNSYVADEFKLDWHTAMDAQPTLQTDANSAVPAMLTTMIDPDVIEVVFAPLEAAEILGENRKGTWLDETAMFPVVEHTGEVSSYGDYANNGSAGVNMNWPQRQSYLFQTIKQYGERELERAGLGRIDFVGEIDKSAAWVLSRYQNQTYFFGVAGLQNYGLLNDPNLSAALTPSTKANGGTKWVVNGVVNGSANEIYLDIESLYIQLVAQTNGLVKRNTKMTLAMSPQSESALTATNSFNVNVSDLLTKNFPNMRVVSAPQYGVTSASNPQGIAAGNLIQLIADELQGQKTGYAAFNEKLRAHKIINDLSAFKQKMTGGSWGMIIRMPVSISQMIGV